jgi:hypothetical protein
LNKHLPGLAKIRIINLSPRIAFVICPHGFGHIRRVCEILSEFKYRKANAELSLFVKPDHYEKFESFFSSWTSISISDVIWQLEPMTHAPDFQSESYTYPDYQRWISELKQTFQNNPYDLVVSDNLYGVLEAYPNALIQGSFSWGEIGSMNPVYNLVAAYEKECQLKFKPSQICLNRMSTPLVRNFSRPHFTHWWCVKNQERNTVYTGKIQKILITAGGTKSALNQMNDLVEKLSDWPQFELLADKRVHQLQPINTIEFNFSEDEFNTLDLIIARPGIGILTESVKYSIPLFCYGEPGNLEMNFNSTTWSELNFGLNFQHKTAEEICDYLLDEDIEGDLHFFRSNLLIEPCGGQIEAFDLLYNRIN